MLVRGGGDKNQRYWKITVQSVRKYGGGGKKKNTNKSVRKYGGGGGNIPTNNKNKSAKIKKKKKTANKREKKKMGNYLEALREA